MQHLAEAESRILTRLADDFAERDYELKILKENLLSADYENERYLIQAKGVLVGHVVIKVGN